MLLKRISILTLLTFSCAAQAVVIDNRDWRQVSETTNITYDQMSQVCNLVTGACNGAVGNVDMTDWIWADDVAIASMFEVITGAPDGTFDADANNYTTRGETWADAFMDVDGAGTDAGLFDATWRYTLREFDYTVFGLTRHVVNGNADRSYIRVADDGGLGITNSAVVGNPIPFNIARVHTGHWLYKDLAVPAPPSVLTLLFGLTGLGAFRLKKHRK